MGSSVLETWHRLKLGAPPSTAPFQALGRGGGLSNALMQTNALGRFFLTEGPSKLYKLLTP